MLAMGIRDLSLIIGEGACQENQTHRGVETVGPVGPLGHRHTSDFICCIFMDSPLDMHFYVDPLFFIRPPPGNK